MRASLFIAPLAALLLGGCVAKTAVDVVTAPVRITSRAVDLATTSQSEADEKRGREMREREERLGRLERRSRDYDEDCRKGRQRACDRRDAALAEIEALRNGETRR